MVDGISVVIPTRNRWDRLRASLAMVLTQSYQGPLEVIVVDDGGSDGTAEHLRGLGDPRIKVLRRERAGGVSTARNTGLAAAAHRWVAFADDDDIWAPTKLERQLAAVEAMGGECWCAGAAVTIFDDWSVLGRSQPPAPADVARRVLTDNPIPGGGSGVLVSAELARRVGGFDAELSLLADWDLWTRLAFAGPFVAVDELLLCYVMHDTAMSLDAGRALKESAVMRDRYAGHRSRLGVDHFGGGREWIAGNQVRAGNRMSAIRTYSELAVETRRRGLLRPIVRTLLGPALCARLPSGFRRQKTPSEAALSFVEDLRQVLEDAQRATGLDDASLTDRSADGRAAAPDPARTEGTLGVDPVGVDPVDVGPGGGAPVEGAPVDVAHLLGEPPAPGPGGISPSPPTG